MILTFDIARQTSGRFFEFEYETTVTRSEKSAHFGCFKDNNDSTFTMSQKVYCWNEKDFFRIVEQWNNNANGLLDMYSYRAVGMSNVQGFKAEQVLERIYERNKFKYLAHLSFIGGTDVIM